MEQYIDGLSHEIGLRALDALITYYYFLVNTGDQIQETLDVTHHIYGRYNQDTVGRLLHYR